MTPKKMPKAALTNHIPGVTAEQLIEMIIQIHNSCVDQQGAVPRDYIAFLKMWYNLCLVKKAELINDVGHLEAGLDKLESAAAVVNDLRTNAKQQEHDLKIAQAAADKAMEDITKGKLYNDIYLIIVLYFFVYDGILIVIIFIEL